MMQKIDMEDMFNHNRGVPNHDCQLPEDESIIVKYIHSGMFVPFRRKLKKFLMVSPLDPQVNQMLRSTTKIRLEEIRHLDHFYHVIHPFSEGRFFWETIMIVIYLLEMTVTPLAAATRVPSRTLSEMELVCYIFIVIDMIFSSCTGYLANKTQKIILHRRKIIKNYLMSYFVVDLIAFFPFNMLMRNINLGHNIEAKLKVFFGLRLLLFARFARIPTMLKYIRKFCERMKIWGESVRNMSLVLIFAIIILTLTVVQTFLLVLRKPMVRHYREDQSDLFHLMLESCHQVVMIIMLIGPIITAEDIKEMIYQSICLLFGSIINMVILAKIMQIYYMRSKAKNKYNSMMQQITEYMKYKELPEALRTRVFRYLDFRFRKHIFKESQVLSTVSTILKQDILMHNCKRMIDKVDFFKDLPTALIMRILDRLKTEVYLPGDVIVQAGIVGNAMFFLCMGKVAVYSKQGLEITHLTDGSHFGEIALVINQPRIATVIAIMNCEVFRLSRKDFQEAIEPYPELRTKIRASAMERLQLTHKFLTESSAGGGSELSFATSIAANATDDLNQDNTEGLKE